MRIHAAPGGRKFIRMAEAETLTGLSRSTIYRMVATGNFPKPCRIGLRAVGWPESEVDAWMSARRESRS